MSNRYFTIMFERLYERGAIFVYLLTMFYAVALLFGVLLTVFGFIEGFLTANVIIGVFSFFISATMAFGGLFLKKSKRSKLSWVNLITVANLAIASYLANQQPTC